MFSMCDAYTRGTLARVAGSNGLLSSTNAVIPLTPPHTKQKKTNQQINKKRKLKMPEGDDDPPTTTTKFQQQQRNKRSQKKKKKKLGGSVVSVGSRRTLMALRLGVPKNVFPKISGAAA